MLQANDWDLTNAGTLNFAVFGVQSERFLIDNVRTVYPRPNSRQLVENFGTINSISAFDYETDSLIEVQLTATDEDIVMTLSSSASVRVFICDDNDLAPYFETDFYSKSITEAHTVMSSLLSIRVSLVVILTFPITHLKYFSLSFRCLMMTLQLTMLLNSLSHLIHSLMCNQLTIPNYLICYLLHHWIVKHHSLSVTF